MQARLQAELQVRLLKQAELAVEVHPAMHLELRAQAQFAAEPQEQAQQVAPVAG
jgi:hypothetical protein